MASRLSQVNSLPPAWPVAPRPFTVEPIGGWLGRVATRYRMSVDELAQLYGLDLAFDRPCHAWLLVGQIGGPTIDRIARLARANPAGLNAMQGLPVWSGSLRTCVGMRSGELVDVWLQHGIITA